MSISAISVAGRTRLPALLGVLALAYLTPTAGATIWTQPGVARPTISATLEQCLTAGAQSERSATFAGEMASVPGSARMAMRIDLAERPPDAISYHLVNAPGLGVWRYSAAGVKAYRYLKQVTNLGGPAFYRAIVRFRWLSSRGHLLATATLHTKRCEQPATSVQTPNPGASAGPALGA
jgi:hypothetical protein